MAKQSRNTLKGYFETGKRPTEGQYANLIDTHLILDGENTGSLNLQGNTALGDSSSHTHTFIGHITASGNISSSGIISVSDGSYSSPSITFGSDTDTGIYRSGNNSFHLTAGGITQIEITTTEVSLCYADNQKLATTNTGINIIGNINSNNVITGNVTASNNISASGYVSASVFVGDAFTGGTFTGDGSGLTNITSTNTTFEISAVTASIATGSLYLTGSVNYLSGSTNILLGIETSGSILPNTTGEVDLGSPTKYWKDLYVSESHANKFIGTLEGQAATVATITGLAPDTATTQATQGNITSLGTLTTLNVNGNVTASGDISSSGDLISKDLYIDQYIKHTGDTHTHINFTPDRIRFDVGGISYLDLNDNTSAPHDITFNDGGNDVDFKIKGNTGNNPLFKTDASKNKIGMHGVGEPDAGLHIADNLWVSGSNGHITASGNISSSAEFIGASANISNITSSGNISSSGNLIIGNITSSGNISASNSSSNHVLGGHTLFYRRSENTGSGAGITIENVGTGDSVVQFLNSNNRWVAGLDNSDADKFKIAGGGGANDWGLNTNTYFTLMIDGKIGLGNDNPTEKLVVAGNVSASGEIIASSANITNITGSNVSASGTVTGDTGSFTSLTSFQTANITASGGISASGTIYAYTLETDTFSTTNLTASGNISASGYVSTQHITASGNISASGDIYGSNYYLRDKVLGLYHGASSTIRLADSSEKTEIYGTNIHLDGPVTTGNISSSGTITGLSGSYGHLKAVLVPGPGLEGMSIYPDGTNSYLESNFNNLVLQTTRIADDIILKTSSSAGGPTTKMFISSSGNVGIGTITPDAKLEVAADGTTSQEIAYFGNSNGIGKIKLQLNGAGGGKLEMLDGSNNEDIVLDAHGDSYFNASHGNVGIGTSAPGEKLTVAGNISSSGDLYAAGGTLKGPLHVNTSGSTATGSNAAIQISSANNDSSLRFGHSPSGTGHEIRYKGTDGGNNNDLEFISEGYPDGESSTWMNIKQDGQVALGSGSLVENETGIIFLPGSGSSYAGNVGIGTTTPTSKLEVAGNINTTSHITASGNISASGDVIADDLYIEGGKVYGDVAYNNYLDFNISSSLFKIQNLTYVKFDGSSAQREVTINEGTNDIDFVVKGESNNPLLHADANTGKIGMHGVGTPTAGLHIADDLWVSGSNGHITASGNISSSGNLSATGDLDIDGKSHFTGHITASSNISASGVITGLSGSFSELSGNSPLTVNAITTIIGNLTASGDVSSSGTITAGTYIGLPTDLVSGSAQLEANISGALSITAIAALGGEIFSGSVATISGSLSTTAIAALGAGIYSSSLQTLGHITSSGTIQAEHLYSTDDAVIDGNITSSGNISASGDGLFKNVGIGTPLPGEKLEIVGTTATTRAQVTTTTGNAIFRVSSSLSDFSLIGLGASEEFNLYDAKYAKTPFKAFGNSGNNTLVISSSMVGIGDISPSSTLDVAGNINTTSHITSSGNIKVEGNISASGNLSATGDLDIDGKSHFAGHITASGNISASGTGSFAKMGIGNTSPTRLLSLGDGLGSPNIQFLAAAAGNSRIEFADVDDSDVGEIQYMHSDNSMRFATNDTEQLIITSTGNVGIGNTTPGEKITVEGNISSSGAVIASEANIIGHITASGNISASGGIFGEINLDDNNKIKLGTGDDLEIYHNGTNSVISEVGTGDLSLQSNGAKVSIYDSANSNFMGKFNTGGSVELLYNGSTKFTTTAGGIDITGEITASGNISSSGTITSNVMTPTSITNVNTTHITASGDISASGDIIGSELNIISSNLNGGTRMNRITYDTGHSGSMIMNDLHATLDLYNPLEADTLEKGSVLTFSDNYYGPPYTQTTRAAIKGGTATIGNTANGFLAFYTDKTGADSMLEQMRIDQDGNVMIGTLSSSAALLTVAGGISSSGAINTLSHITASGNISASGTGSFSDEVIIGGAKYPRLIIATNHATTGDSKIDLKGARETTNTALGYIQAIQTTGSSDVTLGGIHFRTDDATNSGKILFLTNDAGAGDTTRMSIKHDGKVGIGTETPEEKLTVQGNISSSGAINTLSHITSSGNISSSGTIKALTLEGRTYSTGSSNAAAINITMTEAVYPGGSVIGLDMDSNTNDVQYTLPALTAGLKYDFLVNTDAGTGVTLTITSPSAGNLTGIAVCRDGNERILGDDFVIASAKAAKGDRMELISDGNVWNITAFCSGSITDVSST